MASFCLGRPSRSLPNQGVRPRHAAQVSGFGRPSRNFDFAQQISVSNVGVPQTGDSENRSDGFLA